MQKDEMGKEAKLLKAGKFMKTSLQIGLGKRG